MVKIEAQGMAVVEPDRAVIFFDRSDPQNRGWAYNVILHGEHTSGALDSRRAGVKLSTLHRQLVREFRRGSITIPALSEWTPARDGNGWAYRG